jgi:hypothetical protein
MGVTEILLSMTIAVPRAGSTTAPANFQIQQAECPILYSLDSEASSRDFLE